MKLNPNLYIRPEWTEPNGMVITGLSFADLYAKIAKYRAAHKLAPGNPEAEFVEKVCREQPTHCLGAARPVQQREARRASLNTRILNWIERVVPRFNSTKGAQATEARRRAEICAKCPLNKEWESACAGCTASVRKVRTTLVGRLANKITGGDNLHGCDPLGEDIKLSIWMERPPEKNTDLPANCWRKAPDGPH